jgi:hypothetical protein
MRCARIALLLLVRLSLAAPAAAGSLSQAPNCPIFPATSVWNKVNRLPVRKDSRTIVNSIGPILPGLARYDEVAAGSIDHALRFTVRRSDTSTLRP